MTRFKISYWAYLQWPKWGGKHKMEMVYCCEEASFISLWAVLLTCGISQKKKNSQSIKNTNSWAAAPDSDSAGLEKCFILGYSDTGGPQTFYTVIRLKTRCLQCKGLCNSLFD